MANVGKTLFKRSYLNTTNVSVQCVIDLSWGAKKIEFKYNKCIGSMSLFHINLIFCFRFKYNKCIGSINPRHSWIQLLTYLNTTNVSVQFDISTKCNIQCVDLNTTNVSVQ